MNINLPTTLRRFIDSKYSFWLTEIGLFAVLIFSLAAIILEPVSIDGQYIPTVMNGLASGTAILVGFGAASLAMLRERFTSKIDLLLIMLCLILPAFLLFLAYIQLIMYARYIEAIRIALAGLGFAVISVLAILLHALREYW